MRPRYECDGREHGITRRKVLGMLAGGTLGAATFLRPSAARAMRSKQKQVLFIWLDGGMSQLETWDPKPGTPFGGPFRSIKTSVPGVHISELMPETARRLHKIAVVRSMSTKDNSHSVGVPRMLRGDPANRGVKYPYIGSAMTKFLEKPKSGMPPYIWVKPYSGGFIWQHGGFLGARHGALALGDGKPPVHINRPDSITDEQDSARNELRLKANARFRVRRLGSEVDAYESTYGMADKLMRRKELFDDSKTDRKDAKRYGTHPLGRHLLQARKLLEAGVSFVKVTSYHWDTHCDNFRMHQELVPQIDRPYAAILDDLEDRGMLDHVLVVLMSEFGRTPKINARWGRDHWPEAWSLALAGTGIKGGVVVGKTSANGAFVDESPFDVGHVYHTMFRAVGLDAQALEYDNNGQPLPVLREDCEPIKEVLA